MHIYAIGDLHLSGEPPIKPMSVFGANWENHWQKIKVNWLNTITEKDLVIICGDISWAMKLSDALTDLTAIDQLPGKKVFIRGNHDYWWSNISKMQKVVSKNCFFIHNNFYAFNDIAICGSRSWLTPNSENFTLDDGRIYKNELARIERSLSLTQENHCQKIILALHYPPAYLDEKSTGFTSLCDKYQVQHCVYGHLHDESIQLAFNGTINNTNYHLVSADALGFKLKLII